MLNSTRDICLVDYTSYMVSYSTTNIDVINKKLTYYMQFIFFDFSDHHSIKCRVVLVFMELFKSPVFDVNPAL